MKSLLFGLLVSCVAVAQEDQRPLLFLGGTFGMVASGGYANPLPGALAGMEHTGSQHYARVDTGIVHSVKTETTGGYTYNVHSRTYAGGRWVLVGGGASWTKLITPEYRKSSWHPFLGGMLRGRNWDMTADYVFSGTDRMNRVHGVAGIARVALGHRLRLREQVGIYRFHPTLQPSAPRRTFMNLQAGIDYIF